MKRLFKWLDDFVSGLWKGVEVGTDAVLDSWRVAWPLWLLFLFVLAWASEGWR